MWLGLTPPITYDHFIHRIVIKINFPEKAAMQKNLTHYVFSGKFVKIIILIIKRLHIIIADARAYHKALTPINEIFKQILKILNNIPASPANPSIRPASLPLKTFMVNMTLILFIRFV